MILVTGGTGLVGAHLLRHLASDRNGQSRFCVLLIDLLVLLKKPNRYLTAIIKRSL
jgi:nucleoside-diphosphate-sugar epimerase